MLVQLSYFTEHVQPRQKLDVIKEDPSGLFSKLRRPSDKPDYHVQKSKDVQDRGIIRRRVMEEAICASLCNPQAAANPELRVEQLQHPLPIRYHIVRKHLRMRGIEDGSPQPASGHCVNMSEPIPGLRRILTRSDPYSPNQRTTRWRHHG